MKNILTILIFLMFSNDIFCQEDKICFESNFEKENVFYKSDTFLLVKYTQGISGQFIEESNTNAYLFSLKNNFFDTLLSYESNYNPFHDGSSKEQINNYLYDYLHPNESLGEIDSTKYENYYGYNIEHVSNNVFKITESEWSDGGGAHGSGTSNITHYDVDSNMFFNYYDVFKSEAIEFIYKKVKQDFYYEGKYYGYRESELDSLTLDHLELNNNQYYFNGTSIIIQIEIYDTLFGVFYIGYNYWYIEIPYLDMKKYMIKNSPIWRMKNYNK